jgi:hypothetical protein
MTVEYYQHLTGSSGNIADLLAMPACADTDFEIPLPSREVARPADLA